MNAREWHGKALTWEREHYDFIYAELWPNYSERQWHGLDEAAKVLAQLPDGGDCIYARMVLEVGE